MDYNLAKNYWKKKDAEGKKLDNTKLKQRIEAYLAAHDTMALATSRDDIVNNTPVAYTYYKDNFYFLSEGGRKFANLETNKNACCAIFDQMSIGSCKGLQITGTAEIIEPDSAEYQDYFDHIGETSESYSKNLEYSIPLVKITVKYLDYFDSTLKKEGYHSRQHLEMEGEVTMSEQIFQSKQTKEIIAYVRKKYGDELEFLWQKFPKNAIWRNKENQRWYAALLVIPRNKLAGETSEEEVEIIDIRFQKNEALDFAESNDNVFPGYHMNKNNWITVILDGSMETEQILDLLDHSYNISLKNS